MNAALTTVVVEREHDVVFARQRARQLAALLGFDRQDQTRIATAVSELARNTFEYAGGGRVEYRVTGDPRGELVVRVADEGPGIAELDAVLDGRSRSTTGMGRGIAGARRLMDRFEIDSRPGAGTTILVAKTLPPGRASGHELARIAEALGRRTAEDPLDELQLQNQELMQALDELQAHQEELAQLNRELEETNRGVLALYAELDERAEELKRSSEAKSRFLSSLSHELRTPLTAIVALCDLLAERTDGPLTGEQARQVDYIRTAADGLVVLVNDLLDLARIEAGKATVRPTTFEVDDLFGSLRGMFRPLHHDERVTLVFEPADGLPTLSTDESKLAQILRNFISNALKFTEEGEVRVSASSGDGGATVSISVTDTGIGIAPEDHELLFEEFVQLEGPFESAGGSGLGLSVSRRLAQLLGGSVAVESRQGAGSTFTVTVPTRYAGEDPYAVPEERTADPESDLTGVRVLVVDDDETARYVARRALSAHGCRVFEAVDGASGVRAVHDERPDAVVLDLRMPGDDGFAVLRELRADPSTAPLTVVIHTALLLDEATRSRLERDADALLDKHEASGQELVTALTRALAARRNRSGAAGRPNR